MVWLTVLGVLAVIVYCVVRARGTKRVSNVTPSLSLPKEKPLSVEQARVMVDAIIAKGNKLFVEPADEAALLPELFGPITREFFSKYGTVRTRRGGFRLAAADVRPSEYMCGYLSIGHSEDWDVIQKPGNDAMLFT